MRVTTEQVQARVPVTILRTHGEIDGSNFMSLIAVARELRDGGTTNLLVDLSDTPYMSSAGVAALQSIAAIMRDGRGSDGQWDAYQALDLEAVPNYRNHFKLINTQPRVQRLLEMLGFERFLDIYRDEQTALAAF